MSILIYVRCGLTCQTQTHPMSAHYNVIDEDHYIFVTFVTLRPILKLWELDL